MKKLNRRRIRQMILREMAILQEQQMNFSTTGSGDRQFKGTNAYVEPLNELAKSLANIPDIASDDFNMRYNETSTAIADALEAIAADIRNSSDNHMAVNGLRAVLSYDSFRYQGS